jgi:hypothetical protein
MLIALTVFSALAVFTWRGSDPHLSAYFDRRDPAACPAYRDRHDDELLGCIRRAREAQRDWMTAKAAIGNIGVLAETYLLPPMLPFFAWSLVSVMRRVVRSLHRRSLQRQAGEIARVDASGPAEFRPIIDRARV